MNKEIIDFFNNEYSKNPFPYGEKESSICEFIDEDRISEIARVNTEKLNILDIGGGSGRDASFYAKLEEVNSIEVIDISNIAITKGRGKLGNGSTGNKIKFVNKNALSTSFEENYYDIIFSYQFFHFIDPNNLKTLLGKIAKALKPKGWTYHMFLASPYEELKVLQNNDKMKGCIHNHEEEHFKSIPQLKNLGERPFDNKYVLEYHHGRYHSHHMYLFVGQKNK